MSNLFMDDDNKNLKESITGRDNRSIIGMMHGRESGGVYPQAHNYRSHNERKPCNQEFGITVHIQTDA